MSEERQSGFLHRWSRRKIEAREGAPSEPAPADRAADPTATDLASAPPVPPPEQAAAPELPTMEDVQGLTSDSDFSRFVAQGVTPDVKNAALKKLFSDPHYNVMDGLDTYIDDYSQLEPLPQSALRKMAVSKVLGFFEEEARCAAAALTQGEPAAERGGQAGIDSVGASSADDTGASALPAPAELPAEQAYIDMPEPATRAKP